MNSHMKSIDENGLPYHFTVQLNTVEESKEVEEFLLSRGIKWYTYAFAIPKNEYPYIIVHTGYMEPSTFNSNIVGYKMSFESFKEHYMSQVSGE